MTDSVPTAGGVELLHGDCRAVLPTLPAGSVDGVVTDPPYPEIDRPYGRLTEAEWWDLMRPVVAEVRRVLKPTGSAVFVLQPNSERVGRMRSWVFDFQAWLCREWNLVQDAYWWNPAALPTVHAQRRNGLMRPSVKVCVWAGPPDCYRDQDAVLWAESDSNAAADRSDRALRNRPSGYTVRPGRASAVADERGGVTPFNLIPIPNTNSKSSGGARGHGAATPFDLCAWWVRYLTPPGGTVLDPFAGSGTVGEAAVKHGRRFVGIELVDEYVRIAAERLGGLPPPAGAA